MTTTRFHPRSEYRPTQDYKLLPFRFGRLEGEKYVLTNDVGEYVVASRQELAAFIDRQLDPDGATYKALKSRHFLFDDNSTSALDLLALKHRTRAERVANFTGLHIFVTTLRCDHSCHYCQVSRQSEDKANFDMTIEHAEKALDLVFRSPSPSIKIEFQGGEPLLNFGLIQHIVQRANVLNESHQKRLGFVIASNLSRLSDEILSFCKAHQVCLSTSLDGPKSLHDAQRPLKGGSSYQLATDGINRAREALGPEFVSALMTSTPESLGRIEEIVDEYVRQGFRSIFLRHLSPYGFAARSLVHRYSAENWIEAYKRGLAHILKINQQGYAIREELTAILLQKMFSPAGTAYVDLQSPAGIGIGAIVYNYDGFVYASDEGRMLAEMGDFSFRLGHLDTSSYEAIMTSDALLEPLHDTVLDSSPMCNDCAFSPYCGADPIFHKATQGDSVGHKAFSAFCKRQMGVLRHLIGLMENDAGARQTLLEWV
jgi:His-Xaa-Ser system radical SAM maturase HxsB